MRKTLLVLMLALSLTVAACGSGETAGGGEGGASAAAGEKLFAQASIGSLPGCAACHSLEPDVAIVGPSLAGIGGRAGSTVSGMSAEDYVRQSVLEPDAFVVEGFPSSVMPQTFGQELSEEQLDTLVAYLLTLK